MKKNILQIYSLLGCFISSFMTTILFCLILLDVKNLAMPSLAYAKELVKFESKKSYLDDLENQIKSHYGYSKELQDSIGAKLKYYENMNPQTLHKHLITEKEEFLRHKKHQNISDILTSVTWLSGTLLFLLVHFMIYRRTRHIF